LKKKQNYFKLPPQIRQFMHFSKKYILLSIFILHYLFCFSQNKSFISDSIRARQLYFKAITLGKEGLQQQALDTFFSSLDLRKKIYGNKNYKLGAVYSGIGISYRNLGNYNLSLKYFLLAEKSYELSHHFSKRNKIRIYSNIGNVYRNKLDFNRALQYFNRIRTIYENDKNTSTADIAAINYKIADIYYLIKDDSKALEITNKNINNAYAEDKIRYHLLLAYINQIHSNIKSAKNNYQKAIQLSIHLYGKKHITVANQYLNYSLFLMSVGEFNEAEKTLNTAFLIIKNIQPKFGLILAHYYNLRGNYIQDIPVDKQDKTLWLEQKTENLHKAIQWYRKALTALKFPANYSQEIIKNSSENYISTIGCINYLKKIATTYTEIASVAKGQKPEQYLIALSNAINNYQIAGTLIQKARMELSGDKSKIQLTELEYSTFQDLVQTAYCAYTATKNSKYTEMAFESAERIKSSSVFDKLTTELAMENSLIPDSLLQLERRINSTITIYTEKLFEENSKENSDPAKIEQYKTTIFKATRKRENLNRYLEQEYNDYYNLKYSASMLSIRKLQKKMGFNDVILEYVLNEKDTASELYTFTISKNSVEFNKQDVGAHFVGTIESVFRFMANPEYAFTTNDESKQFCVESHQLYNHLIFPFRSHLQNKHLTIIPDGKLNYIAFEALLQNLPDTTKPIQFNKLDYLIKSQNINYSNSANLLFQKNKLFPKMQNKVVAFAPEYNNDTLELSGKRIAIPPLPGVQKEVKHISNTVKVKVYKGNDATEQQFRAIANKYDILHLAMHAYINDSLPGFSRLVFSPTSTTDNFSDGLLNTADIYNLNLNARLTVLSACNTGGGILKKGEGIMSLARGFFYAGCPAIIMSLWEVDDQSATKIMQSFYKNLKRGNTKSEALRQAKLKYLSSVSSRRAHPHYWLGYISIGNNMPLYKSYDFYFFVFLVIILVLVALNQILRIKKARKKRAS